jgi:hypothetical protein
MNGNGVKVAIFLVAEVTLAYDNGVERDMLAGVTCVGLV